MSGSRLLECARENRNGGFYHPGDYYRFEKKLEVVETFFRLWEESFPHRPTYTSVATQCKVCHNTVRKYLQEFEETGTVSDPQERMVVKKSLGREGRMTESLLSPYEEHYLLSLRADDPSRPLNSYAIALREETGRDVSVSYLSDWWKNRFFYRGVLKKSSLVPVDKFRHANWVSYYEYRMYLSLLKDHTKLNFVDEKHLVNNQGQNLKVRADPVTGILDGIPVSGNFRDAQSIIACISANHEKERHLYYTIDRETNNAESFLAFIEGMVRDRFLIHDEILIMDNAPIHRGGSAAIIEDFLWSTIVDGRPLKILVIYLPTRSPELNPIELVFNILASRMKSFKYRTTGPVDETVVARCCRILDEIEFEVILRCIHSCGYLEDTTTNNDTTNDNNDDNENGGN